MTVYGVSELKEARNAVDQSIQRCLDSFPVLPSWCFSQSISMSIPERSSQEGCFVPPIPDVFCANPGIAYSDCLYALRWLYKSNPDDGLPVYRHLGALPVSTESQSLIGALNRHKDHLKNLVTSLPKNCRTHLVRAAFPDISLLQAYRHWPVHRSLDDPLEAIHLTWSLSAYSKGTVSCEQAIEVILLMMNHDPREPESNAKERYVQALSLLKTYPLDHRFNVYRPVRPHPRYQVKTISGKWKQYPGHLPLICVGQSQPPQFQPLHDIELTRSVKKRSRYAPGSNEYLIDFLGILKN